MQDERFTSGLTRLSEVRHYEISDEDPDPRGWTVVGRDGQRIGEVRDLLVDPTAMKVRYFEVEMDSRAGGEGRVLVDAVSADLMDQHRQVIVDGDVSSLGSAEAFTDQYAVAHDRGHLESDLDTDTDTEAARVTRAEEELRIGKREVQTGEVVVNKTVETEQVREPVQRRVERVRVERRPVSASTPGNIDVTPGEIRVPIIEEEIVVEKRPVVKEEIVVTRDVATEADVVETEVRKERVDVLEEGTGTMNSPKGGRHGRH